MVKLLFERIPLRVGADLAAALTLLRLLLNRRAGHGPVGTKHTTISGFWLE